MSTRGIPLEHLDEVPFEPAEASDAVGLELPTVLPRGRRSRMTALEGIGMATIVAASLISGGVLWWAVTLA
ncbi:hypothetical protein [Agromyces sp. SYSU T00194]|uniref:hypothetical protein n=1 Tax=Agromyces chitinivorans TaxID=3158560 RepID=UPI00339AEAFE